MFVNNFASSADFASAWSILLITCRYGERKNMSEKLIIWLLFAHWIADFVCQSDWMAQNKSKSNHALTIHCNIYGFIIGIMTWNILFGIFAMFIHFPVDYVTSRINSKLWADKKVHWFFVGVGFDQWIHFVTLIILAKYLLH